MLVGPLKGSMEPTAVLLLLSYSDARPQAAPMLRGSAALGGAKLTLQGHPLLLKARLSWQMGCRGQESLSRL